MGLSGTFPKLDGFPFLRDLDLFRNKLEGSLPRDLSKMKHLSTLRLTGNLFSGELPSTWYQSRAPRSLSLDGNNIHGALSADVNQWKDQKDLYLSDNIFTGTIPDFDLRSLGNLHLSQNKLSGTLPPTLSKLERLTNLFLNGNQFTGSLPGEAFTSMTALSEFQAASNLLSGTIPSELWQLTGIRYLHLSNNRLSGTLSPDLGNAATLRDIFLDVNKLTGEIPTNLALIRPEVTTIAPHDAVGLRRADFSGNAFNGTIPKELCSADGPSMDFLAADCKIPRNGGSPEVLCPCCTTCCNSEGMECIET